MPLLLNYLSFQGRPLTKTQLKDTLRKEISLSRTRAREVVELFFDEISDALASGQRVEIRGLCSIYAKQYRGYAGRNPKTGKPTQVPPKKLPFFKSGKELKDRVDYE